MDDREHFSFLDGYDAVDRLVRADLQPSESPDELGGGIPRWEYFEKCAEAERERRLAPTPNILPAGEGSIDGPPMTNPDIRKWSEYLSAIGFHHLYTPDSSTHFTLYARASEERVHLLLTSGGTRERVLRRAESLRWPTRRRTSDPDPKAGTNTDWRIAVGSTPALDPVTWRSALSDWRSWYLTPGYRFAHRAEWEVMRKLPWLWFRDVVGIAISGTGLCRGEPMSIAQCPICGEMSFVPFEGWAGMPLKSCQHRDESRPLPVIYGLLDRIVP
ncbi:hypothetical protein [Rhodococcus sp. NPDC006774]|uniref:hypothetical protein n=1 Tax=Rhodococcus sp. NPDC006774 TaxID=3157186 RepID=UPI0033D5C456